MFKRKATLQIRSLRALYTPRVSSLSSTIFASKRCYASENHNMNPKVVDLIYKMQTTPSVMDALRHFEELVDKKGLKEQAGFGRFISMMKDKEVEEALRNVMIEMEKAGITISQDIVEPILKSMTSGKK